MPEPKTAEEWARGGGVYSRPLTGKGERMGNDEDRHEPATAAERADLLMDWYEGHTVPSQALRDEIVAQLRALPETPERIGEQP